MMNLTNTAKQKSIFIYSASFVFIIGIITIMFFASASPEDDIIGKWKEIKWEYEKVNDSVDGNKGISAKIKNEIAKGMVIHKAEMWEFSKNGKLVLEKESSPKEFLDWKLKGRGHILKIEHESGIQEFYNLYQIDKNQMVLYFSSDIHAKGIVKMVFEKV